MEELCRNNCTSMEVLVESVRDEVWGQWDEFVNYFEYQPWFFSLLGSVMVGLSGVFPLLVIPIEDGVNLKNGAGAGTLRLLLSFAVGGLLGDVFLHLLPEAWGNKSLNTNSTKDHPSILCGLWVLTGFLVFIIAEKIFVGSNDEDEEDDNETDEPKVFQNNNKKVHAHNNHQNGHYFHLNNITKKNGFANGVVKPSKDEIYSRSEMQKIDYSIITKCNGFSKEIIAQNGFAKGPRDDDKREKRDKPKGKHISGYLNLMANCIDNFTHGLAVGGSFLVSFRLGALTTFAILIHEIPHEVGDFAILLKSGFNRWDAARAQLITATGGILGALVAVAFSGSGVESRTSWILPFTAGGFLHIGLVTVLPELLQESNPKESMKQLGALLSGITIMAILTILCD
ncbi:zinc transporter ZIP13 homolog [Diachasma alloeum]|uniref:zinc transporter ZIP13 homolog n=1 Tax=Diachasma alloeum TaxID=454923 RepID=UPI0007384023|nr:zinc transporter ZIP13 homolog [Diachasma alloeum]